MAKKSRRQKRGGTKKASMRTLRRRALRQRKTGHEKRFNHNKTIDINNLIPGSYYEYKYHLRDQVDILDDNETYDTIESSEGFFVGIENNELIYREVPSLYFHDKMRHRFNVNFSTGLSRIPLGDLIAVYEPTPWAIEKLKRHPEFMNASGMYSNAVVAYDKKMGNHTTENALYDVLGEGPDSIQSYL